MVIHGDCLEKLKEIDSNSIDALVTDPPAGISFMGKEWDKSEGFIPFMIQAMSEVLRVLKPGAHGFVWAIPRTSHWTASACEAAHPASSIVQKPRSARRMPGARTQQAQIVTPPLSPNVSCST